MESPWAEGQQVWLPLPWDDEKHGGKERTETFCCGLYLLRPENGLRLDYTASTEQLRLRQTGDQDHVVGERSSVLIGGHFDSWQPLSQDHCLYRQLQAVPHGACRVSGSSYLKIAEWAKTGGLGQNGALSPNRLADTGPSQAWH